MSAIFDFNAKTGRRSLQLTSFELVQQLPDRAQAAALHALWPERLPKIVSRRVRRELREQWRVLRGRQIEWRIAKELQEIESLEAFMEEMTEREILSEVVDEHGETAQAIAGFVARLPNMKSITVSLSNGSTRKFPVESNEPLDHSLMVGICLALKMGGGILMRHTLPLRTQVKGADGQMQWLHQERVYGIVCGEGQYRGLTASEMKASYIVDGDGKVLEFDPVTSFGNAKDLLRAKR